MPTPVVDTSGALLASTSEPSGASIDGQPVDDLFSPSGVTDVLGAALSIVATPVFCCNPLSIDFSADVGSERSDRGVAFAWDFGDGRHGRGRSLRHTYPFPGTYAVRLSATLPGAGVEETVYNVAVGGEAPAALPDEPPGGATGDTETVGPKPNEDVPDPVAVALKAVAGPDMVAVVGDTVTLDGSGSKGSGAHDLRFQWVQVSGPPVVLDSSGARITSFVAPEIETDLVDVVFDLTVSESASTASDRIAVRITRRSDPLVIADAGKGRLVDGGSTVVLDGSQSRGTGSRPISFGWVQIDGPAVTLVDATDATTSFVAPDPTNRPIYLTFELTVTQGALIETDTVEIVIAPVITMPAASDAQVLTWLTELAPLQKVHYSWPMPTAMLHDFDKDLLREYMRISHAMSVWGEWVDQDTLERTMSIAWQVNDEEPEIPVSLGLVFRPWTRVFPPSVPPTYNGPEADEEVNFFVTRLDTIKGWVDQANQAHNGTPIEVTAIILECERFVVKPEDDPDQAAWNAAVDAKHNVIYEAAKEAFPDARIEWYARGISDLFTLNEKGDSYSIPLYQVPDRVAMRTLFRRTHDAAAPRGATDVTPWVALGSSYISQSDGSKTWSFDYDYDLIYSWHIGAEVNDSWFGDRPEQFAPWNDAKIAIFWPAPWEARIPNWPRHFIAYVRGAHNITELPR